MTKALAFNIPGPPVPKARARAGPKGFFTPKRTVQYKRHIQSCARVAMLQTRGWDLEGYYLVELTFRVPDRRVRDGDNMEKAILDAMQGIVYRNDCRAWVCQKTLVLDPKSPGVSVAIRQVLASEFFRTA